MRYNILSTMHFLTSLLSHIDTSTNSRGTTRVICSLMSIRLCVAQRVSSTVRCLVFSLEDLILGLLVGYTGYFGPYSQDFIKACLAAGVGETHDLNTHKGTLGVTKVGST